MNTNESDLRIVEGVAGCYAYHLSRTGKSGHATLCGITNVMSTCLPNLRTWNCAPSHIRSKYCAACSRIAAEIGVAVPEATPETLVFNS
jgi:hypothetical protein